MDNPVRILILEDNPADAELAQRELRKAGIRFTAEVAADQAAFLRALGTSAPDLILSDFSIPGFDGLSAMALARERFKDIPVIIVSGAIGEETAIDALKAGATDYVLKTRLGRLGPVTKRALDEARHLWEKRQADEELARQKESLQRNEEELRLLLEGVQDYAIFRLDVEGRIVTWAPGAQRVLQWRADEVLNQSFSRFYPPEDIASGIPERILEYTVRDGHYEVEGYRLRKDGSVFWAHVDVTSIRSAGAQPLGFVAVVRDMSERKRTEEALQHALALAEARGAVLDALMEHVPEGITIVDAATMQVQMVSRYGKQLLGGPSSIGVSLEAYANQWHTCNGDGTTPMEYQARPLVRALRHGETIQNVEMVVTSSSGRPFPLLSNAAPIRDASGRITGAVAVWRDITDLKQAEAALRDSERHARQIIDNMLAFVGVMDLSGTMRDINASALEVGGLAREEVVGRKLWDTCWWNYDAQTQQRLRDAVARATAGEVVRYDVVVRLGTGGWMDIDFMVAPVRNDAGQITHLIPSAVDITQRKQAEKQVRLQAAALEAAANGIAITDAQGNILWINPALSELTGYRSDELVGRNPRILKSGRQDEAFYHEMWETIRRGETWHGDLVNRRKDGSEYVEEMTISPLRNGEGAIINFIAIKQDISPRRAEQEALAAAKISAEQARRAAEEANRAKDQFLAVLSHELRTPLTPVVAAVSMLQEGVEDEQTTREALEMIRRNVEMEARLIDDLLDVTRIVRGKIELQRQPTVLCEVIHRAVEVCRADIETRKLHFGLDLGPCASCQVDADPTRLQQVYWNLLKNAVKFTPHGGCIGIRCRMDDAHVITEVVDSGEGIEPNLLPHIFNPFEQGGARITRQFGGLGLGLTITKGVVELHGGTIQAHSEGKGKGATFRVRLPLCTASANVASADSPGTSASPASAPAHKPRILLVEDHGDTAKVMHRLLVARGYEVETAGDMATALDLAEHGTFDLLLSDLGLPDGSGVDLMRKLRDHGRSIPGIALSGFGQEEDVRRSKEAGFAAHLTKPTNPETLTQTIGAVIRHGAGR